MGHDTADVTVHIDETLDHARLETVAERVEKVPALFGRVPRHQAAFSARALRPRENRGTPFTV